jgi:hypothetical protein
MEILKTLAMIADEYGFKPKTFSRHIKKDEVLKVEIKRGLQPPIKQKTIYTRLGFPPSVNKSDYDNV